MAIGASSFSDGFAPLDDLMACDFVNFKRSDYKAAEKELGHIRDFESCMATIDKIFDIADLDHNQIVTRCEHAKFMHVAMDKARRHPHLHTFQSRKQSINVNMGHNMQ